MSKAISANKKAYHNYEIMDTYEAGIVLIGQEIKAIRAGKVNLQGSFARVAQTQNPKILKSHKLQANKLELFLLNAHISVLDGDPIRTRKLLMHRKEISHLIGKIQQKGLSLIALELYLKRGKAKIKLGLARGLKLHDKREIIKKKDYNRSQMREEI